MWMALLCHVARQGGHVSWPLCAASPQHCPSVQLRRLAGTATRPTSSHPPPLCFPSVPCAREKTRTPLAPLPLELLPSTHASAVLSVDEALVELFLREGPGYVNGRHMVDDLQRRAPRLPPAWGGVCRQLAALTTGRRPQQRGGALPASTSKLLASMEAMLAGQCMAVTGRQVRHRAGGGKPGQRANLCTPRCQGCTKPRTLCACRCRAPKLQLNC